MKKRKLKNKHIKIDLDSGLTLKMELFCRYYLFGGEYEGLVETKNKKGVVKEESGKIHFRLGNATLSYALAYGYDLSKSNEYLIAGVGASENLKKPKIKKRMRAMLEDEGFNDHVVDSRLLDIIKNGRSTDATPAIKEYNNLMKRIEATTTVVIVDQDKKGSLNKALEYLKKK